MVWLAGAQRFPSYDYSKNLKLMTGSWGGYGYVLRNTVYDFFLSEFAKEDNSCDTYYSTFHAQFNSFRILPELVTHTGSRQSDRLEVNMKD